MNKQLQASIGRIRHRDKKTGFCILELKAADEASKQEFISNTGSEIAVALGVMHNPLEGLMVTVEGYWSKHAERGMQLKTSAVYPTKLIKQPHTLAALESRLFKSINREEALKIYNEFGESTFTIIEEKPFLIKEKTGLDADKVLSISKDWVRAKKLYESFNFLKSLDVSNEVADRIIETFGNRSKEVVSTNPYSLLGISGFGFKTIDPVARKVGFEEKSESRIHHGLSYAIKTMVERGHTASHRSDFTKDLCGTMSFSDQEANNVIDDKISSGEIAAHQDKHGRPLIVSYELYRKEKECAEEIKRILTHPLEKLPAFIKITNEKLVAAQKKAIYKSLFNKVSIITGGPGVGKTTTTASVIEALQEIKGMNGDAFGKMICLAAPTGKAARRITESTNMPASTIHSLLEMHPEHGFKKNQDNQLDYETIIIDESSMIDLHLFHALLKATPSSSRLIFVGDEDQLSSVDAGNVLGDLIKSNTIPVTRLTEIHRQGKGSLIITNAHKVIKGEMPELNTPADQDFHWVSAKNDEEIAKIITRLMSEIVPNIHGIKVDNIQVLSPQKGTLAGVDNLNIEIRKAINPPAPSKYSFMCYGNEFRINDRVMQTKNSKELGLSNGEIGKIEFIDYQEKKAVVNFDGNIKKIPFSSFGDIKLACATTIHKSQGSEFECVIIPISDNHANMLTPQTIYTGMTRGKKQVYFVGSEEALKKAMKNGYRQKRNTTLADCLTEVLPKIEYKPSTLQQSNLSTPEPMVG